jgi:type II secretory pathway pseudopilin PulG
VAVVVVSVIAVAALVAAGVLARARGDLRQQVSQARAEADRRARDAAAHASERDALAVDVQALTRRGEALSHDVQTERARADDLAKRLDAATATTDDSVEAGLWQLLLAHVTRRWGAVVGVPPDKRSIVGGATSAQLAQALARETERLREEVGVDVQLTAPEQPPEGEPGELAGRVAVLVAALELLGVLASSSQRVTVDVGESLVLTGEGWVDPYGELTEAYDRASAAGVVLDPLDVGDEHVRLVIRHGAG